MELHPLVIAVAPNGAGKSKLDHPALPITPDELATAARECLDAGAAMMHLHVRDADGRHSLDAELYRQAISAIRRAVGDHLVIQATSESSGLYAPVEQMEQIRKLKPEAVSVALRELLPDDSGLCACSDFLAWLSRERITPQYILFSAKDLTMYEALMTRGVIPDTAHWLLYVLGRYETGFTSAAEAILLAPASDVATPWAVCAFGRVEHLNAARAVTLGGHVRVGFENNLYLKDGTMALSNAQLVAQVGDVARAVGRPVADAHLLREMFC